MNHKCRPAMLALCICACLVHARPDVLRPEIGEPLRAAQALVKAKKFKQALAKVREAQTASNITEHESYTLERMRISAAIGAADLKNATRAFKSLSASGQLPVANRLQMLAAIASGYYRTKNYSEAVTWTRRYLKDGGQNPRIRRLLAQSLYLSGAMAATVRELREEIQADENAGVAPAEDRLKLMLNASAYLTDRSFYIFALERNLTHYPTPVYWTELIEQVRRKPSFSNRYLLDIYRIKLASANMTQANDYMEMAQLALQAGFAAEAKVALGQGFGAKILGTGKRAARHRRLRDLVNKRADTEHASAVAGEARANMANDGAALVKLGMGLALSGQAARGADRIKRGLAKGGLTRPGDANLRLGQALVLAGQPAKAVSVLRKVVGKDGAHDIARMWILLSARGKFTQNTLP